MTDIDIQVGLLVFAANQKNPMNHFVLLEEIEEIKEKNKLAIPAMTLQKDADSISIVYEIIEDFSGITGKWVDMTPKQVGVFDDVKRNPKKREIFICYSLFLPEPIKIFSERGYQWIRLDELSSSDLYLDTEYIIRYSVLSIGDIGGAR